MTGSHVVRGSRVGSGPSGDGQRGAPAPRASVSYWCSRDHETVVTFGDDPGVETPDVWDCRRCGLPAGPDRSAPPEPNRPEPYKSHLAYVKERRSHADGDALLDEALRNLRRRAD